MNSVAPPAANRAACTLTSLKRLYGLRMVLKTTAARRLCKTTQKINCKLLGELAVISEMAWVHSGVTDRIRVIRRLDFTKQPRKDATYQEHAKILQAILHQRGDQAAVRKITLHQVHLARQVGGRCYRLGFSLFSNKKCSLSSVLGRMQPHIK